MGQMRPILTWIATQFRLGWVESRSRLPAQDSPPDLGASQIRVEMHCKDSIEHADPIARLRK